MPLVLAIAVLLARGAAPAAAPTLAPATVLTRFIADEAHQGVAVDDRYFYAIDNSAIGKYDKRTGKPVARWRGDPRLYPHINSCVVEEARLVCAASNHPDVPMASSVEIFDTATLHHVRSIALPPYPGSLTWIERHDGSWFALFANYDQGHGGEPGHDHRWTLLMRLDDQFRPLQSWRFPDDVLTRFAPMSCSGGSWGDDGLLYVTGHTRGELYAMRLPSAGTVLEHVATIPLATGGQAFGWDPDRRVLWSIDRARHAVAASAVPAVARMNGAAEWARKSYFGSSNGSPSACFQRRGPPPRAELSVALALMVRGSLQRTGWRGVCPTSSIPIRVRHFSITIS